MRSFRLAAVLSFAIPSLVSAALNQAGPSSELHVLSNRAGFDDIGLTEDPAVLVGRAAQASAPAAPFVTKRHNSGVYCRELRLPSPPPMRRS